MTGAVKAVEDALDPACFVTECKRDGCKVNLEDAPTPHVIVDCDNKASPWGQQKSRCDFLFAANGGRGNADWVVLLELSRGYKRPSTWSKQLQAAANVAAEKIDLERVRFIPVYVGATRSDDREEFRKPRRRITFQGRPVRVRPISCGDRLTKALREPE